MDIKPKFDEIKDAHKYIIDTCGTDNLYDDVLIMADLYDVTDHYQDIYYVAPYGRFFDMWREGPCTPRNIPYEQPFVAIHKPNN